MSDALTLNLPTAAILKAVEAHLNRTMFKAPVRLSDMEEDENGFNFTITPADAEPRAPKVKKQTSSKRGLKGPVLQQAQSNGSTTLLRSEGFTLEEQQEA